MIDVVEDADLALGGVMVLQAPRVLRRRAAPGDGIARTSVSRRGSSSPRRCSDRARLVDRRALGNIATPAYHAVMSDRTEGDRATRGAWTEIEKARDVAARRAAVRRAHALGPGANIEEAIRLIRAGEAMHGAARR